MRKRKWKSINKCFPKTHKTPSCTGKLSFHVKVVTKGGIHSAKLQRMINSQFLEYSFGMKSLLQQRNLLNAFLKLALKVM